MKKQETVWNDLYKNGLTWRKISKVTENMKNKIVLELGVGNGKTLKSILNQNPKSVTAIDISREAIGSIKIKDKKVSLINADFLKFNSKNGFDIIVCHYFLNNFKKNERQEVVRKVKGMLNKKWTILFEDFAIGDFRQRGKEIEKNTIEKKNGIICHFFEKNELRNLFKGFDINIQEKTFKPIRKDKNIKRKIIQATIRPW